MPLSHEMKSVPLRHTDIVADIGAFVGEYARYAAAFPVVRVRAFEAAPENAAKLRRNCPANLIVIEAAVTGSPMPNGVPFYLVAPQRHTLLPTGEAREVIVSPAIPYARAVVGASVVKIDVEGAEYDYLPIVQPSLRALIIDFHWTGTDWRHKAEAMIADIVAAGFTTIVQPDFSDGLRSAGSWIRELT